MPYLYRYVPYLSSFLTLVVSLLCLTETQNHETCHEHALPVPENADLWLALVDDAVC